MERDRMIGLWLRLDTWRLEQQARFLRWQIARIRANIERWEQREWRQHR
jgi:hypothetical protein